MAKPATKAPGGGRAKKKDTSGDPSIGYRLAKGGLTATDQACMERLLAQLRLRRQVEEQRFADEVIVWSSRLAAPDGVEATAMAAIDLGQAQARIERKGPATSMPRMTVVKRLDNALVMAANDAALMDMRATTPGLRVAPVAWAYPQYLRTFGDELDNAAVLAAPGAKARKFQVHLATADGRGVEGVRIKALLDWNGAHVAATTDGDGLAELAIPVAYDAVVLVLAEPEHTWWSLYTRGFRRVDAPRRLALEARPLVPDSFQLIGRYAAHDPTAGEGVTVGVIDSGIGPHDALEVAGGACFVSGEDAADFEDNGIGHGTHVAGTIAARPTAGSGVYGLAPMSRLLAYRVCPKSGERGRAKSSDIAAALERAIVDGCDIVNISMGSMEAMPEIPNVLEKVRAAGIVVIAATGNDGQNALRYPGRYSHTLAVGALGRDGTFPEDCPESFQESEIRQRSEFVAEFSNHGIGTDFIGPGVAVVSTFPGNRYAMMSGTSMSTPYTSGMAARLLSKAHGVRTMPRGPARADAIVQLLTDAARRVGFPPAYEGFGVLT